VHDLVQHQETEIGAAAHVLAHELGREQKVEVRPMPHERSAVHAVVGRHQPWLADSGQLGQ
jgi:predicted RNA-binding protein Jag